jgi:peptide chain release factor subunit 1
VAATVTWESLRELAGFRSESGCAFSIYLDLDPSDTPTPADAGTRLRSLLARAEKEFANGGGHGHGAKVAVGRDLARIREWWGNEFDRDRARGLAIFVSGADGLWRVLPLPRAVRDDVHLGRRLRLTPLVDLAGDGDGTFVAVVNRERGQVFHLRAGRLEEIIDRTEEQPGQHDQGGWSQARFQRHIEKLVAEHLKRVGGEIDKRVRRTRGPQLVIVAPEELRAEIEGALSVEARESIVGWASARANASPLELLAVARPHLERARAERIRELVERWREERGRHARASAGWAETLPAASDGRVELLLLAAGADRKAFRCPQCGRAEAEPGSCPLDGTELEPDTGSDIVVQQTLAQGGSVATVSGGELDGDAEGVGALLRF